MVMSDPGKCFKAFTSIDVSGVIGRIPMRAFSTFTGKYMKSEGTLKLLSWSRSKDLVQKVSM